MIKAILIDIGHGLGPTGNVDNGGVVPGMNEREEVSEIGVEVMKYAQKQTALAGVAVYLVGYPDRSKLVDHIKTANDLCAKEGYTAQNSLLISVHTNKGGGGGVETWYKDGDDESKKFGQKVLDALAETTGLTKRKANPDTANQHGRLGIVRDVRPRAILVECGFIDNPTDFAALNDEIKDDLFAIGIVKGIVKYLGLNYQEISLDGPFPDVSKDRWSADAIAFVKEKGWMTGYGDGLFRPTQPISREEMAEILYRIHSPQQK